MSSLCENGLVARTITKTYYYYYYYLCYYYYLYFIFIIIFFIFLLESSATCLECIFILASQNTTIIFHLFHFPVCQQQDGRYSSERVVQVVLRGRAPVTMAMRCCIPRRCCCA